jgi:hypothetical protein
VVVGLIAWALKAVRLMMAEQMNARVITKLSTKRGLRVIRTGASPGVVPSSAVKDDLLSDGEGLEVGVMSSLTCSAT